MNDVIVEAAPRTARPLRARPPRRARPRRLTNVPFLFAAPSIILVTVFYALPVVLGFAFSFTDWNVYRDERRFVGLYNYEDMLSDGTLGSTMWVTLQFAIVFPIVANLLALVLAFLLERPSRINSFFRTALFIPVLITGLAAGYLFKGMLSPGGTVNQILSFLNPFGDVTFPWLGSPTWTIVILAFVQAWKSFGLYMIVYIAALSTIPDDLVKAARIDGAGTWAVIRHIKLPLMVPGFTFNTALALIGGLQTFELVISMTQGGPGTSTIVLNYLIYQYYGVGNYGFAAAISVVLFVAIALLTLPLIRTLRRREVEL